MGYRGYNRDKDLILKDNTAVTATAAGQVAASNKIIDVGDARFEGVAVMNFTARDFTTTDETYSVAIEGSNSSTFASGVETLARTEILANGRVELPFVNRKYDTQYRYIREKHTLAGTTPSITFDCYVAPLKWC
jgi:hypothetical protein